MTEGFLGWFKVRDFIKTKVFTRFKGMGGWVGSVMGGFAEWVDGVMGGFAEWVDGVMGLRVGFININDMYNNDVGKGVVYAYEAYEAK